MSVWKNFSSFIIGKILSSISKQKSLMIQLDITNSCNLNCTHCYHDHHINEGSLTIDQWSQILIQYKNLLSKLHKKPYIIICGGEPFTSPILKPLMMKIHAYLPYATIVILTNGTLIEKSWFSFFKKFNISFQVSLDGPDKTRNDSIRGKGSLERAIEGIKKLKANNFEVSVLSVLSSKSMHWISDFFALAKKLNLNSMNFTRMVPQGNAQNLIKSGSVNPLVGIDLKNSMLEIIKYSLQHQVKTNTSQPLYNLLNDNYGGHGLFGYQGIIVDYKGNMKVSSRSNYILGNIFEKGLNNLFLKHPLMKELRQGNIEGCNECQHKRKCSGDLNIAYATYGSFLKKDPGCWITNHS